MDLVLVKVITNTLEGGTLGEILIVTVVFTNILTTFPQTKRNLKY